MKIYNQNKSHELSETEIDNEKGYLKPDKIVIIHHDDIPQKTVEEQVSKLLTQGVKIEKYFDKKAQADKFYIVTEAYIGQKKYVPSEITDWSKVTGKTVEEIKEIPAKDAYDEEEDIQVYIPYTEAELKERADSKRHAELKVELTKVMEDIEQEALGIVRNDYTEKKARAAEIISELRVLEGKEPRKVRKV